MAIPVPGEVGGSGSSVVGIGGNALVEKARETRNEERGTRIEKRETHGSHVPLGFAT